MSKIYSWLFIISMTILMVSCGESENFLKGEDQVFFKAKKKLKFEGLLYAAKMKASFTSDTVVIELKTENVGDKPVKINLMQAELMGQNGVRSNALMASTVEKELEVGQTSVDTIYFSPVNDMDLYNNTYLKGAIGEEYFLLPGAVGDIYYSSANIKLIGDKKSYDAYQALDRYSGVVFYDVDRSDEYRNALLEKTTDLISYTNEERLNKTAADSSGRKAKILEPDVKLSRKELLQTGIATLVKTYSWNNSTIVDWRMLNHQGTDLKINPEHFRLISDGGQELKPEYVQMKIIPASWKQEKNRLLKGERIAIQFSFKDQNAEKLVLKTDITYADSIQLIDRVPFKKFIEATQE